MKIDTSELEPGNLPLDVFNSIAFLTVTPVIELIATTTKGVLLLKRSQNDLFWPNLFCLPGGIIRSSSESIDTAIEQIVNKNQLIPLSKFNQLDIKLVDTARGKELALIYHITLMGNHKEICPWNELSQKQIIKEHLIMIENYIDSKSK